jgi:FKBP-type peptidyl-prolyl cis-trans isomerase
VSLRFSFGRRTAAAALLLALSTTACLSTSAPDYGTPSDPATETFAASLGVDLSQMTQIGDAPLYYQDITPGNGADVVPGNQITVAYTGWLPNGTKFDSGNYQFTLQGAMVIAGWDYGIPGMKVGGKRRLVIGSDLGYGPNAQINSAGQIVIPSNSTLVFDVTVVSTP